MILEPLLSSNGSLNSGMEQLLSKESQPLTDFENSQDDTLVMDLHGGSRLR
jgi:hypothetical protein